MTTAVSIDDQSFLAPTWNEMGEMTVSLAAQIRQQEEEFDRIIALAKGGWGWARQLQDLLEISELSGVQISFYEGIGRTKDRPIVIQSLPISIKGERVLIYDDVVDTGETVQLAKDYLSMHGADEVATATHFTKSWTKLQPDFSSMETDAWIVFPHDALESIRELANKWSGDALQTNLEKMGIHPSLINFALKQ